MANEEEISERPLLYIFLSDWHANFSERPEVVHVIDCTWEDPEEYGRNWARWFKDDIVMIVGKEDNG